MSENKSKKTPGPQVSRGGEKAKDFKGTIKKLLTYLGAYKKGVIAVLILAIVSTVFTIVGPRILGNATDLLAEGVVGINVYDQVHENLPAGVELPAGTTGKDILSDVPEDIRAKIPESYMSYIENLNLTEKPHINFDEIGKILLTILTIYLLSALFSYIQGFIMTGISQKIVFRMRKEVDEKLDKLPVSFFDRHTYGDILSRVSNDIDTVSTTLQQSLTQIITSIATIIGVIIMMLSINVVLTLIVLLTLPISAVVTAIIAKKSQKQFVANQRELGEINSHVEEMYSGQKIVKAFGKEEDSIREFNQINHNLYTAGWKSQFISGIIMPLLSFISNIGYVIVCIVGGLFASNGSLSVGNIQAFIQYTRSFQQPITQVANMFNVLQSTAAAAERVFELLAEKDEIPDTSQPIRLENPEGSVDFKKVDFGYTPDKILIKDMNLSIKPGQTVAIVGPTGAGKTTLVNLLMRFYELNSGSINVDGVDITQMTRHDLRDLFGMVLQDTWLFNGTIKDNIGYGRKGAELDDIIEAAKTAHAHHFIRTLNKGYDTVINEEASNISQGQKQLLTIARAVLKNPKILILDEATSSVDTRTEVLIQKAMANLMKGRTSFVIAHRLSTIKNADQILVMNEGTIIEQGTHQELLEAQGFYADLYNSQFTGGNLEEIA